MKKMLGFRLDDIAPGMRLDNLRTIEEIFDKWNICPLLGIVPDNKDDNLSVADNNEEEYYEYIHKLIKKGWTPSMHGYTHVYSTEDSGLLDANPFSEFAGVEYDAQLKMLAKGKKMLADRLIDPEVFMAPGHTFDENTIRALKRVEFTTITDGYTDRPYKRGDMVFIPCTLSEPKIPKGMDTVCIHVNNWDKEDFDKLDSFLNDNHDICVSFSDMMKYDTIAPYSKFIEKKESNYRKLRDAKNSAAANEKMQEYLQKSYSDNKALKLVKRVVYSPMLLKK